MLTFKKLLQAKEEEQIQRKRKNTEEAADRKSKRRRQSKESSDDSVSNEDQTISNEHIQTLSDVSEQSEEFVEETKPIEVSEENKETKKRDKEKKNAEMRIEVCEICGTRDDRPIACTKCKLYYHLQCIKKISTMEPNAESLLCHHCDPSTESNCCLCQQSEGEMLRCNFKLCGRRYHRNCLKLFHSPSVKQERPASQFTCPAHYCHTCVAEMNELHQPEKKLLRCIHCPTAYHQSNF